MIFDQIEAIMNDYIQLKSQSNIYEAETMVEGEELTWCLAILLVIC